MKKENDSRFRELFENMSSGAAVFTASNDGTDFIVEDFNWAGELIERKRKEDVIGGNLAEVFPEFSAAGLLDVLKRVLISGDSEYRLISFINADDEKVWRENHIFKLPSSEVVNVYDDVTAAKKADEELKERESEYHLIAENTSDLIAVTTTDGNYVYASPSHCVLGYDPEELLNSPALDLVHPDDLSSLLVFYERYMQECSGGDCEDNREIVPASTEYRIRDKWGNWRLIETASNYVIGTDGRSPRVVNVARDITERNRMEQAIKQSEESYRVLVEESNDLPYTVDQDGNITYIGPQIERYGYTHSEIMSRSLLEFIDHEDQEQATLEFMHSMSTGKEFVTELRIIDKSGVRHWFEDHGRVQRDGDGNIIGLAGMLRDIGERKQEEEARRQSEQAYRVLFESTTDGLFLLDAETMRVILANRTVARFFGLDDPDEAIGINPLDYVHPEDQERVARIIVEDMLENDLREFNEIRGFTSDGRNVWVETVGTRIEYLGKPAGLISIRDITVRKEKENDLIESELRLSTFIENAPDAMFISDTEGRFINGNKKAEALLGYRREDLIGRNYFEAGILLEEYMQKAVDGLELNRKGKRSDPDEYELIRKDGSRIVVEIASIPISREGTVEIFGIVHDITDRKQSEREIIQRNKELTALNSIVQTVSQSINLEDIMGDALDKILEVMEISHGTVALWDEATNELKLTVVRGISEKELKKLSQAEINKSEMEGSALSGEPVFLETLNKFIKPDQKNARNLVKSHKLKSAMFVPLKAKSNPLGLIAVATQGKRVLTDSEIEMLTTIGHAISAAVENARLLEAMSRTRQAEETDRLRAAFLASISHEIRTPLTSIKGLSSTLVQPDVEWDAETQKEFLLTIDQESNRLLRIVEDVLDMSKIEAGAMKLHMDAISIGSVMSGVRGVLDSLTKDHKLKVILPDEVCLFLADEIRIGQVITNLVQNASVYSPKDTQITLEANLVGDVVIVSVTDEGEGIPEEHLELVFDRFYRMEETSRMRKSGTGLGLAICRGIIEAHGGNIWAENVAPNGAQITFTLPLNM